MPALPFDREIFHEIWKLGKQTVVEYLDDSATLLGAGIAYYALFSVAPILVLVIAIAGLVFGDEAAQGQIVSHIADFTGPDVAGAVQSMVAASSDRSQGIWATIISGGVLLFGAHMVFAQLQRALNLIWDVPIEEQSIKEVIRDRALALVAVLSIGPLFVALLLLSTAATLFDRFFGETIPGWTLLLQVGDGVVSIVVLSLICAGLFKFLPDVEIRWRDVSIGAVVSAVLLYIGKLLIGFYVAYAGLGSTYGAAGSVVILMVWVYYSTQIFLLGAEFTQIYAARYGPGIRQSEKRKKVEGSG